MTRDAKELGRLGERVACDFLQQHGYRVLARGYACPLGEIDLICYGDGGIVFVEVKTRSADEAADPEESITAAKRRRMTRAARHWLAAHREPDCPWRFDAVSVVLSADGPPRVRHIVEAFIPSR